MIEYGGITKVALDKFPVLDSVTITATEVVEDDDFSTGSGQLFDHV
jgi:hypothetical protein